MLNRKYITSSKLNNRITCFEFTSNESGDKPSPISFKSNKLKISQTGQFAHAWYADVHIIIIINYSCTDVEFSNKLTANDW